MVQQEIREDRRALILGTLMVSYRPGKGITRNELLAATDISPGSLFVLLADLEFDGLIATGPVDPSGGTRAHRAELFWLTERSVAARETVLMAADTSAHAAL